MEETRTSGEKKPHRFGIRESLLVFFALATVVLIIMGFIWSLRLSRTQEDLLHAQGELRAQQAQLQQKEDQLEAQDTELKRLRARLSMWETQTALVVSSQDVYHLYGCKKLPEDWAQVEFLRVTTAEAFGYTPCPICAKKGD